MTRANRAERADVAVAVAVAPARKHAAVRLAGALSEAADQPPLISACTAMLAAGLVLRDRKVASAGLRMLAAELAATGIKTFVKHRIDRTRPAVVADGGRYHAEPGSDDASEMNSFPSGHTAGAVAVARAFGRDYPAHRTLAYSLAAAVGIVQVPRSKHYASDVAVGTIIGLVGEQAVDLGARVAGRAIAMLRRRPAAARRPPPPDTPVVAPG